MQEIELESKLSVDPASSQRGININNNNPNSSTITATRKNKYSARRSTVFDKGAMSLSQEQRQYIVAINKRNYDNNFYLNNIDQSIAYVIPYKYKCSAMMFLLLGIPYIIAKVSNKKFAEIRGVPCPVKEAEFYLIIDEYGNYHICEFSKKMLDAQYSLKTDNKGEVKSSESITTLYSNIEFKQTKEEYHVITYEYNQYFCYEKNRRRNSNNEYINGAYIFEAPVFSFRKAQNSQIYKTFFNQYLTGDDIYFQQSIYGVNKLTLKTLNFCTILLSQFKQFFFVYPLFAIALWIYEEYLFYIVIITGFIVTLIFTTYQKYLNKKSIIDFSLKKEKKITLVKGKGKEENDVNYEDLVPGQIIKVKEEDVLPCDCLLLEGFCSVIESTLTGESSSVMKYRLQNSDKMFNYSENSKSFLFSGTKIEKASPNELQVLVVGTGFNTQRGNLIQSVLFPKKSNFNFYKENLTFFIFVLVIFLIAISVFVYLHVSFNIDKQKEIDAANQEDKERLEKEKKGWTDMLLKVLDMIFIVLPPTLSISLTVGTFYYQYSLNQRKIRCSDEYRLIAAGRVNKIILDKTGTLTKEDLELYGYRATLKKKNEIVFDSLETDSKLYLSFLTEYYKRQFSKRGGNEEDDESDNTMTFFLECLATCHSIAKIDGEHKGNCIDMKIFENIKWQYEEIKEKDSISKVNNDQYEMKPKKYYQITEEQYFNANNAKMHFLSNSSYSLKVIMRCPFDSRHQSMSVIVKNKFNGSIHFYIKGAPEKISLLCKTSTLPESFQKIHKKYTLKGFRVLACASKRLEATEESILNSEKKFDLYSETDLTFLGFIIFQNRLKKKTKEVFTKLINEGLFPIISTGDNAFTSISVVKECNLIEYNSKFCIMDINTFRGNNADTNTLRERERQSDYKEKKSSVNKLVSSGSIILKCSFEELIENNAHGGIYEDVQVRYNRRKSTEISDKMSEVTKTAVKYMTVGELNDKLLSNPKMKLCIHSRVFDVVFFRDHSGREVREEDDDFSEFLDLNNKSSSEEDQEINILRQIIVEKAVLFFRMSPSDKSKLIQLYKKQDPSNIVCMCGDGANDCSALISADVGISLKSSENSVMTSHLMANTKSISVVNDIITIGRTCFENSSILLKIILMYAELMTSGRIILESKQDDMTNSQYIFIDFIIIFCGCCLISISEPNFKTNGKLFEKSILFKQFLFSVLGHSVLQVGLFVAYFFFILDKSTYYESEIINDSVDSNNFTFYNSYCFILLAFQCLSFVFTFNFFSVQKESTFKNRILTIYLIIVAIILSEVISVNVFDVGFIKWKLAEFVPLGKGNNFSQISRIILFAFSLLGFILCVLWEYIIYYCFVDRTAVVGGIEKIKDEVTEKEDILLEKETELNEDD